MWSVIYLVLQVFLLCLLARAVLSWFPSSGGALDSVRRALMTITEPVLAPVRALLPPVRLGAVGLDLSFMVVFFVILIVMRYLPA
jgi:YggT family protein